MNSSFRLLLGNIAVFMAMLSLLGCNSAGRKKEMKAENVSVIHYPLPKTVDSLRLLLKSLPSDTNRINVMNMLAMKLKNSDPDTSILIGKQTLALANGKDSIFNTYAERQKAIANCFGNLGFYSYMKADYPGAIDYYLKSLQIDEKINDRINISGCLGNIGVIYYHQGDLDKALEYYQRSLRMKEELENKTGKTHTLGNIAIVYMDKKEYSKAIDYYFRGWVTAREVNDSEAIGTDIGNIGLAYFYMKSYDKAEFFYRKALDIRMKTRNLRLIASSYGNLGTLYQQTGQYEPAFNNLYRAIAISDSIGSMDQLQSWYNPLAMLYEKSDVSLPDTIGGKLLSKPAMRERALHYAKSCIALRDTIFSQENKKQLVSKELNYQFEKKNAEENIQRQKKETEAKAELSQKETQRNVFITGFIAFLLLGFYILRSFRQKKRSNEIISSQKIILEEKQKEILDSIHYAGRIQRALMPAEKYFEKTLNRLQRK